MADNAPVTPSGPLLSELWEHHGAPTDEEILDHITQEDQPCTPLGIESETALASGPDHCTWESPPNRLCSASFGDRGMTATVNAYGLLMQFGDYLGAGKSGLFSADHEFVEIPYQIIDRAKTLDKVTKQCSLGDKTYGLSLGGLELEKERAPKMSWKNWRWPCYEYSPGYFSDPAISLRVEWMVHNKILLQRCTVETNGTSSCKIDMGFSKDLRINDLDHTGNYADPRLVPGTIDSGPGPGQYTWLWRKPYTFETTAKEGKKSDGVSTKLDNTVQSKKPSHQVDEELPDQKPSSMVSHQDEDGANTQFLAPQQQKAAEPLQYFKLQEKTGSPSTPAPQLKETEDSTPTASKCANMEIQTTGPFTVVVVAAVFVNGKCERLGSQKSPFLPTKWTGAWNERIQGEPGGPKRMEVIAAYRMILVPSNTMDWRDLIISSKDVGMDLFLSRGSLNARQMLAVDLTNMPLSLNSSNDEAQNLDRKHVRRQSSMARYDLFSGNENSKHVKPLSALPTHSSSPFEHLNYVIWRNLEHILSVCSVPVGPQTTDETGDEIQPIALTCGDMSLHRVCHSASLFALQFLLEIAKRLDRLVEKSDGIRSLQSRIRRVSLGHLKWLVRAEQVGECFHANYWVTGKIYPKEDDSDSWHADDRVTDNPFQIIKAAEIYGVYRDTTTKSLCENLLGQIQSLWLKLMSSADPRVKFAWLHTREEGIETFRLDDHVWIWRAFKALESMDMWQPWTRGSENKKFTIAEIQREILQRFTTKIEESGARMLAVTRSVRENRFLFHARDTALFYEPNLEFFQLNHSYRELWNNTIRAQPYHEDNQTEIWDNAIRYALTIAGASSGLRTNTHKGSATVVRDALITLFQTTSPNGFFPGQLDEDIRECPIPALYDHEQYRDFYFHAHFEICYILLVNMDQLCNKWFDSDDKSYTENPNAVSDPGDSFLPRIHQKEYKEAAPMRNADIGSRKPVRQDLLTNREAEASMKKSFPLGSSIDTSKIVDIDEEWLFEYPSFFGTSDSSVGFDEIPKLLEQNEVVARMLSKPSAPSEPSRPSFNDRPLDSAVKIFDVSKKKHVGKRTRNKRQRDVECTSCNTRKELWDKLAAKRTVEDAKKRLILLAQPKIEENLLICYLTTPWSYRDGIDSFFSRHFGGDTHFIDSTSKVYNYWHSELILNFRVFVKREQPPEVEQGFSRPNAAPGQLKTAPCSFGFLFEGDIFDRHWTCYLLGSEFLDIDPAGFEEGLNGQRDWTQRKVLEQVLLSHMLQAVNLESNTLMREFFAELDLGVELFTNLSSEEYLRTSHKRLQETQELLESVEKSLTGIIGLIAAWQNRESDRAQQPRWTLNDERKYRESIKRWKLATESHSSQLKITHRDVKALRDKVGATLSRNLANIAEGQSLRESENMRLFTYVTVVFLPLGFAASVFSMAGTPDTPLLVNMIICAIVALLLTVLMLVNAKRLARMAKAASHGIHAYSKHKMGESIMERHSTSSGGRVLQKKLRSENETPWFLWFWVKYLLVELPARRVIIACRLLDFSNGMQESVKGAQLPTETSNMQHDRETTESLTTKGAETKESPLQQGIIWQILWILQVLGGLLFSPIFVTSWATQLIVVNILDLIRLVYNLIHHLVSLIPLAPITAAPEILFISEKRWRPIRRLDLYVHGGQNDVQAQEKSKSPKGEAQTQSEPQSEMKG